jgi:MscS family membrane protein
LDNQKNYKSLTFILNHQGNQEFDSSSSPIEFPILMNHENQDEIIPLNWTWILPPLTGSIMIVIWLIIVVVLDIPDHPVPYRLLLNLTLQIFLMLFIFWTIYRVTDILVPSEYKGFQNLIPWLRNKNKKKNQGVPGRTLIPTFMKYLRFAIMIVFSLVIAQNFGLPVTSLMGGLGIAGIAIAFAASAIIQNIFGASIIVMEELFHIGDWISVLDIEGDVEKIGFRTTTIRQADQRLTTVPNSIFVTNPLHNIQESKPWRICFNLEISIKTKIDKLDKFLQRSRDFISTSKELKQGGRVLVRGITSSSIILQVYTFTSHYNPKDDIHRTNEWKIKMLYLKEKMILGLLKIFQARRS